ncbi:aldose 1-epimerase family protein [Compostibacter hankyongensis]|uniref:Aldose 1-epimerase family protein n=1 Tax=Compostibacter hankyongensis TaxID=1007089 RepID=A0ABP8FK67_9BACT
MSTWSDKISHAAQLGGIETYLVDNGAGRGARIAWINTGAGLRYKVVIDRAMDIADAFYNRHSLSWLSSLGVVPPQRMSGRGVDWLSTFGGGLLVTCGLDHVGGPEQDDHGERGLHGAVSNLPAEIVSVVQPDPLRGQMEMSITGIMRQTRIFGPSLELRRTLSGRIGEAVIRIHDEVTNRGNTLAPHMLLYHCNFGWPLADEGTEICWQGSWKPRDEPSIAIFNGENNFRICPPVRADHSGAGEAAAFVDVQPDADGRCSCGLYNAGQGMALALRFSKAQLPWLTNWQHWGKGEYVTGLEPGTHPPVGQAAAREAGTLILLEPGESRSYDLEMEVMTDKAKIDPFLKETKQSD